MSTEKFPYITLARTLENMLHNFDSAMDELWSARASLDGADRDSSQEQAENERLYQSLENEIKRAVVLMIESEPK